MTIETETRRESYAAMQPKLKPRELEVVQCLSEHGPLRGCDAAELLNRPIHVVLPRLTYLKQKGIVRALAKIKGPMGSPVTLWELVGAE